VHPLDEGARFLRTGQRGHLVDIGAADEGLGPRAGQHHGAQVQVGGQAVEQVGEGAHHLGRQAVQLLGAIDGHEGDPPAGALVVPDLQVRDHCSPAALAPT